MVLATIRRLFREMLDSKDRLSSIIRSMADPLVVLDSEGKIQVVNQAAIERLEYSAVELIGQPIEKILRDLKDQPMPHSALDTQLGKEIESILVTKRNDRIPCLVSSARLKGSTGRSEGIVCLARDISERKKAEAKAREMQLQLLQASKLVSLGTIGSGVAHELNNPLTIVKASAEVIIESGKATTEIRKRAKEIIRCSDRMKKLTDHLRTFARESKENDWTQIDVNEPIRNSLMLLTGKLRVHDIKLKLTLSAHQPRIWGDSSKLESVFQNLITNSRDAFDEISDDRQKSIRITSRENDAGGITVEYEDNATGIAPENINRVFDPFFTTKEVGKGTGLGMSIIHGIVKQHRGQIEMDSELGRGTKFVLTFPADRRATPRESGKVIRAKKKVKASPTPRIPVHAPKKGATLLIVDDEPGIAQLLELMVKNTFAATVFNDPRQACAKMEKTKFDLIITDMNMPHLSGQGILAKAKECQPETPVVIMTGHGEEDPKVKKALADGAVGVLDKPFADGKSVRAYLLQTLAAGKARQKAA